MDSQKVRSSLSGNLYAFEIPSPSTSVANSPPSVQVATTGEATDNIETEGGVSTHDCAGINDVSPAERPNEDHLCDVRGAQLVRSSSRSSSDRGYGGTLKLPCLSRQTSDDDDDDCIEVGSEVSGKSSIGLLKQFSPRFMRKLTSKKSMNVWNTTENMANSEQSYSVKSTPGHSRNTSISSASGSPSHATATQNTIKPCGYLIGLHRKLVIINTQSFICTPVSIHTILLYNQAYIHSKISPIQLVSIA